MLEKSGKILRGPELYEDLLDIWNGFWDLHGCRMHSQVPNPLAYSEISIWMTDNGISDPEERREAFILLKVLDDQWLKLHYEKTKSEAERKRENAKFRARNRR